MGLTQITTGGVDDNINIDSNTLKVDGTNNRVGIGTASPSTNLEINGGTNNNIVRIVSTDANANIEFADNTTTSGCQIGANGDNLKFGISGTEVVRVDSSGNVGIGTSNPGYKIEVTQGSGNSVARFTGANSANLVFRNATSNVFELNAGGSNDGLSFGTAGNNERMRIDSSGRLLLGTTVEGHANADNLTVRDTGDCGITIRSGTSNQGCIYFSDATSGGGEIAGAIQYDHASNFLRFTANESERMRIDSSGNLLVGTTTAAGSMTVNMGTDKNISFNGNQGEVGNVPALVATNNSGSSLASMGFRATDLRFATGSAERMRIDSSGRLMLGTTSLGNSEADDLTIATTGTTGITIRSGTSGNGNLFFADSTSGNAAFDGFVQYQHANRSLKIGTAATERMRIDSSGNLGVGTTSPTDHNSFTRIVDINGSGGGALYCRTNGSSSNCAIFGQSGSDVYIINKAAANIRFNVADAEKMRIDSSGRLMLGKTTATHKLSLEGTANNQSSELQLTATNVCSGYIGPNANGLNIGTDTAGIIFKTGVTGGGSVGGTGSTRLTIDSNGNLTNKTSNIGSVAGSGFTLGRVADSYLVLTRDNQIPVHINRLTSDGNLIRFYAQSNLEGSISVSGSTVSYNGGHLTRWSQLASGAARTEILRGSVLSNLDEMCEWGEEDNEQLNRMKVSDVEGDRNVAGVFQSWDDDDDTFTNDFYCAMTGDFVIRIAQGTTVARGDLLMSAGDGTAKPQDDDIVRSKTIAKVTSTTVSTTYSDGSYCVPCVLMAC